LANDDLENRVIFSEAVVPAKAKLSKITNGEKLLQWLTQTHIPLPGLLFLNFNMLAKIVKNVWQK
jgi:hypothetical protein